MASTVQSQTLKVTLTEEIVLNGTNYLSSNVINIPSIGEITKRVVGVTTTEATILNFSTAIGAGTYITGNVRYLRIRNLDDTNHVVLTFKDENNTEFKLKLDIGQSFIYNVDLDNGLTDTMIAAGSAAGSTLADLSDITAQADTAACDIEIFIAST